MADAPPPLCEMPPAPSVMDEMVAAAMQAKARKDAAKAVEAKQRATSFGGGLKKGFFAAPVRKPTRKTVAKPTTVAKQEIETIRPTKKHALELPEVQAAMQGLTTNDWMTPDFMDKLAKNPKLCIALQNPRFTAAIQELSTNPEKAMAKYQHDADVSAMLRDFMQFMGAHFEALGKVADADAAKAKQRHALEAAAHTPQEQAQVERILGDPELQAILSDPDMQAVLQRCTAPGVLLRYLQDPIVGPKIRKLEAAGLVQLHP
ncbi:hypothetical protein SPRG_19403 [Saprolegnia parasitica CBS 223.65]|uniref:STI1 domain-containing protein n=1 Tax=Saprolegnia parasitica (strain CBS 223.65) TaxID=695850 RepID=A0A067CSB9_SAPPC|nr:hypothetical protein SPRG_19403 [Saprolegnia parasitica CBS 223.65]KDO33413.1 hypothetical protein SPRG_19403 [Saprolegnia parasitica CBS 223.65]|eukprot:XP_012196281.1 hypothetical protein SPRG_19403 [Saprolegnia parasitica CBS 223.65]